MNNKKKEKYIVITALITNKKKQILLTQRHAPGKSAWDNKWQLPGGEIEFGETPVDTLHREVKEETGAKVKILSKRPCIATNTWEFKNNYIHVIVLCYPCEYVSGKLKTKDLETKDIKWVSYKKALKLDLLPKTKELIKEVASNK